MNDAIEQLRLVLDERSANEPEHERELRRAMRTAAFASEVLSTWGEQELHRGRRSCYGLTEAHAAYARATHTWSGYEADVARWMRSPDNRRALEHLDSGSVAALTDPELACIGTRPDPPDVPAPNTMTSPPHWPDDPAGVGALGSFFAALDADAKNPAP